MNMVDKIKAIFPEMIQWRRFLHQHPELSYHEKNTSAYVAERLHNMGIQVLTGVGGHGVIGILKGSRSGRTVALRADMDALPIQDEKTSVYASQVPGVMHACGHDAHTATLLGVARILSGMTDAWAGTIKFIFQPAEEVSPGGALPMIAAGALDQVEAIYGIHLWTPFPVGKVYSRSGAMMAAADEFSVTIKGKGGHGGLPHNTIDSVLVGSQLVVNYQSIVSRNINPTVPAVVSVGAIHAGNSFNVIAERCTLSGTVRVFDNETRDEIKQRMEVISHATCDTFGASCDFNYKLGYPPVVNDQTEFERFCRIGTDNFGTEQTEVSPLIMAGEDFSYYLQKIPGCFMFVGAGNIGKEIIAPHHHPRFDIDEEAMQHAALLFIGMTLDFLGEPSVKK